MAHDFIYLECRQIVDVKNEIWYRFSLFFSVNGLRVLEESIMIEMMCWSIDIYMSIYY